MNEPRVQFVAEVSSNHHGSLERCLAFVDRAAEIGCDAIKFQLFRVNELFAPEILARSAEHRRRAAWELPSDFLPAISEHAHERGLKLACTPFSLRAVDELLPFVDFYKIASYELLWDPLLVACARSGRPVAISTGMARSDEVAHALRVLDGAGGTELTLLHCVSGYPTPPGDANLAAIDTLRRLAHTLLDRECAVGWSDHTASAGVVQRAVHRFGASMIEFHLDLDGAGEEFAAGHCWLPEAIEAVIRDARSALAADGSGEKVPAPSELPDRPWRADPSDGLRPLQSLRREWHP
ncbi:MAG: N-acetylneuraminic acid synthase [Deltaproteobacteria bacterium]|jgi:N-acetylneuraminate synthase|nr:N-acetylneuraminic acid synthase [Deltaproteobacteria bacterium]